MVGGGGCCRGVGNAVVVLSPEVERTREVPEDLTPKANEPEEFDEEDEVPLVQKRSRCLAQAVLAGMWRLVRTANLTYVLNGTPSSVKVTASEVGSETGTWNYYYW